MTADPSCDRALAHAEGECSRGGLPSRPRLVLATTILASSLAFVDGSVVNVGLPAIGQGLSASGGPLSWVVNGYLVPLSALLLMGGAAGDALGRARLLILGVLLFAVASLLSASAPNLGWLVAGRVLQGTGAAMVLPNSLAILGSSFRGEARGRAIGTWAAVGAAAGAIGPLLGGYLIDRIGWRAIFVINLPIAAVAIALCAQYVPNDARRRDVRLDVLGAGLSVVAFAALTWGLTLVSSSSGSALEAWASLAAGTLAMGSCIGVERHRGKRAMMPLALFISRSFVGLNVLTFLLYGALGAMLLLIPFVLIEARRWSATSAAAALLPLPLVIAAASPRFGQLAAAIGPRLPLSVGPALVSVGCLLAVRVTGRGSYWVTVLPAMLVLSVGMAGAVAPLTTAVLGSVEARHTGVASGFNSAVARTGGLVATALASAVFAAQGPPMLALFRHTAVLAAGAALTAGVSAAVVLPSPPSTSRPS